MYKWWKNIVNFTVDEDQFRSFNVCLTLTVYLLDTHYAVGSVFLHACCLFYQIKVIVKVARAE